MSIKKTPNGSLVLVLTIVSFTLLIPWVIYYFNVILEKPL